MSFTVRGAFAGVVFKLQSRTRITAVALYALVTLLPQLSSGILAILYTRAFSNEEYANYGIFSAVYAFIAMVMDLGISAGMFRNFYTSRKSEFEYFTPAISSARLIMLAAVLILGAVLYFSWDAIGVRFTQKWAFIPVLLAIAYVDRSEDVLATICRAMERPAWYALGRVAHGFALLVAGYLMVFRFRLGIMGSLLALLTAECVALGVYATVLNRRIGILSGHPDWNQLLDSIRFGFPIVPNRLAGWARLLAVRPALTHAVSASNVGIFSFASSMAAVPAMLSSGLEMALSPIYYRRRQHADSAVFNAKIRTLAGVYAGSIVPIWTLMILFAPDVVRFIATPEFAAAGRICSVLLCATFIRMQLLFLNGQIQFVRKTWVLPAITIPCGLLGIAATLVFARVYGVIAAAWIIVAMDLLIFVMTASAAHHFEGLNYPISSALAFIVLLCGLAAAVCFLLPETPNVAQVGYRLIIVGLSFCLCVAVCIWPNRGLIQTLSQR